MTCQEYRDLIDNTASNETCAELAAILKHKTECSACLDWSKRELTNCFSTA